MLRKLTTMFSMAAVFSLVCAGSAFADHAFDAKDKYASKSNHGKGTTRQADGRMSDTERTAKLAESVMHPRADIVSGPAREEAREGYFDETTQPQQQIASNKGKGNPSIDDFEADRPEIARGGEGAPGMEEEEVASYTNKGKGTTGMKGITEQM
ncbi:MAG: hypothetical protein HYV26_05665 [Candidatus Hydrogenedentes bacterium]|nr:hypothetical protein [Candidatus Hydrogenedentota bacterium]MBI3118477.1 hypothetical protein [Candidatus Hydrogenedentota bacterium]